MWRLRLKRKQRILWIALSTVAVAALAFGIYVSNYYHATDVALDAFEAKDGIRVKSVDGVFCLETSGSTDGLVFYPGGKVQAEAYLPLLRRVAGRGIDCYLVKMPFNLAVFGVDRASGVMVAHPHERWFLAGHSLGGAMASRWAAAHPGELDGLVLLAAYPTQKLPEELKVLVLYGSEDGLLNRVNLENNLGLLPSNAVVEQLPGGNHAYFGSYGEQNGDGAATITPDEQWDWTADEIGKLVNSDLSSISSINQNLFAFHPNPCYDSVHRITFTGGMLDDGQEQMGCDLCRPFCAARG